MFFLTLTIFQNPPLLFIILQLFQRGELEWDFTKGMVLEQNSMSLNKDLLDQKNVPKIYA